MLKNNISVSIVIVTWNAEPYVRLLLNSIITQTYQPQRVIVVDNSSSDQTVKIIRSEFEGITVVENRRNLGFSKAYNQGIKLSRTEYVLVCNQDIVLSQRFLENLVAEAGNKPQLAALGGKLMKFRLNNEEASGYEKLKYIDTCGIGVTKARNFYDRGQNQLDKGEYDKFEKVFGLSGALVLYRKGALEKVAYQGEYFDEDFFAYKEDIDLAWRLQLAGYRAYYVPQALAWHARTLSQEKKNKFLSQLKRDNFLNYLSFRNHLFLNLKNENKSNIFTNLIYILPSRIIKFIFYFIFQPAVFFKSLKSYLKLRGKMLNKRKDFIPKIKASKAERKKFFTGIFR